MSLARCCSRLAIVAVTIGAACSRGQPSVEPAPAPAPVEQPRPVAPAAPSAATPSVGPAREYRGAYNRGWEASWFEPCEAPIDDRLWWVTLSDQALRQRDSLLKVLKARPTGALAVRWRGTISERMPAGMMGRGTRYLLVTEIVDLRTLPPAGACGVVDRTS